MNSKELFSQWQRKKEIDRYLFMPLITDFAAKIANTTYEEMTSDSSELSKTLIDCQKLFGYDGMIISFDNVIIAEALGCQVDLINKRISKKILDAQLLESIDNVSNSPRIQSLLTGITIVQRVTRDQIIGAAISGMGKLGKSIIQPAEDTLKDQYDLLQKVLMNLVKAILEKRPDLFIIYEEEHDFLEETYKPILNLIKYFRISCVIITENSVKFTLNCQNTAEVLSQTMISDNKNYEELCVKWDEFKTKPSVLLTAGEVPINMDVDQFHDVIDVLRS